VLFRSVPNTPVQYALFLRTPITGVNKTAQAIEKLLFYAALLSVLAAGAVSFFISRSLTRPISDISRAASRFADGDYSSRSSVSGKDEIGSLGITFNGMAESLADIEQNRRDFLANISHELKTPIASIQALTEAIIDGIVDTPEQRQRYLSNILSETGRINRLIRELSDLSALEAGKLTIQLQNIDLKEFFLAETEKYVSLLAERNLHWHTVIPDNLPLVKADRDRLTQVFANLITNAVRYAPGGSALGLKLVAGRKFVSIAVSDSGPGIAPDDLPYIWDRFYRADKSRARQYGGSGLGLFITRNLVHAMGGEITVESTPGKGATFTFTLPVAG
jgi:signal transduction histidine kinase